MTPDEFRRHGREVIDWIADYMEQVEQLPVLSQVKPGEIRSRLPDRPPQQGEPFAAILRDVNEIILPGITHWQSPNFFAYFPSNNSGPSILGDLLASGLGVQGMLWSTSPACTELETHVLDWLVEALGSAGAVPLDDRGRRRDPGFGLVGRAVRDPGRASGDRRGAGSMVPSLTRVRLESLDREQGPSWSRYASTQTHSSIEKGLRIAGLGNNQFRRIDVDDRVGHAARPPGRGHGRRRCGRPPALLRLCHGGHDVVAGLRSAAEHRRDLPPARRLAARRCGPGRHGGHLPGVPRHARRPGTGRQLLLQSAQVDVHELRLQLLLRRRPRAADPRVGDHARVSEEPGDAVGRR